MYLLCIEIWILPGSTWLYSLIKNQCLPYKIDIQIRLIQSMEIYDALESEPRAIERSELGLANQFANKLLPVTYVAFLSSSKMILIYL